MLTAATSVPELSWWLALRQRISVGLIVLMSAIHLVPLRPHAPPSPAYLALHFCTAGCYAALGVAEAWVVVTRIEPLLVRHRVLPTRSAGSWLRDVCLLISPGWLIVGVVGSLGMALHSDTLEATAAVLEFTIISIYGCYPLSLIGLLRDLEDAVASHTATGTSIAAPKRPTARLGSQSPARRSSSRRRAAAA